MLRTIKRILLWTFAACASAALLFAGLIMWPDPLFAFSLGDGKIIIRSDRPIPDAGGNRLLHDCETLLARSPLPAEGRQYRIYVTNDEWRHRLFFLADEDAHGLTYGGFGTVFLSGADFDAGRLIHNGYVPPRPRTLAYYCGHELTHVVEVEHRFNHSHVPTWVDEVERHVTSVLSAGVAERLILGSASTGSGGSEGSDIAFASDLLSVLHTSTAVTGNLLHRAAPERALETVRADPQLRRVVGRHLRRLEKRAEAVVIAHRAAIEAVAAELVRARHLSGDAVRAIIERVGRPSPPRTRFH